MTWHDGQLWHGDLGIDLVYNRLTDFYLDQPASAALREAWVQQGVVLTPNPLCHALYADKRHLALFSDAARLQALGVPEATRQELLAHAPTLAGQTLQVADWYVGLKNGVPDRLVNAQYSLLRVDDSGRFDLAASPSLQPPPAGAVAALEEDSWPTADQQAQMRRLTWGDPPRDPA